MAAPVQTQIVIVDDHPLFRTGLATVLEQQDGLHVVGNASTYEDAMEVAASSPVDLAIVDILLPSGDGIAVTRALREHNSEARILGLSVLDEPTRIAELIRAGADGFVHKTQPIPEILEAVRATLAGERYLCPAMRERLEQLLASDAKLPLEQLTSREREVFALLVRGYTNDRISSKLGIAIRTVETHRQRIMRKLGAHSIADLVRFAARWGALN
jgi:two-component system, NarL family, response regulator NreC